MNSKSILEMIGGEKHINPHYNIKVEKMTKEEIEKEAEEKFKVNNEDKDREHYYDRMWFKTGYLAGAEPREKRIEELEARCTELFLQNNELAERLAKAKEIIKQLMYTPRECIAWYCLCDKAKQFLKEIKENE